MVHPAAIVFGVGLVIGVGYLLYLGYEEYERQKEEEKKQKYRSGTRKDSEYKTSDSEYKTLITYDQIPKTKKSELRQRPPKLPSSEYASPSRISVRKAIPKISRSPVESKATTSTKHDTPYAVISLHERSTLKDNIASSEIQVNRERLVSFSPSGTNDSKVVLASSDPTISDKSVCVSSQSSTPVNDSAINSESQSVEPTQQMCIILSEEPHLADVRCQPCGHLQFCAQHAKLYMEAAKTIHLNAYCPESSCRQKILDL